MDLDELDTLNEDASLLTDSDETAIERGRALSRPELNGSASDTDHALWRRQLSVVLLIEVAFSLTSASTQPYINEVGITEWKKSSFGCS
jgi:hypothetical protein